MKNLMGKSRKIGNPYLTFETPDGQWQWQVLKSWQGDDGKPEARWFCGVSSPMTYGEHELGDVWVSDILEHAVLVDWDREVLGDHLERLTVPAKVADVEPFVVTGSFEAVLDGDDGIAWRRVE